MKPSLASIGVRCAVYPQDAPSEFNLALTLAKQPANEIEALRRTLRLTPI